MPGFGSLAPEMDLPEPWPGANEEALANARAAGIPLEKPKTWTQTAQDVFAAPGRAINALAATPVDQPDAATQQYFPETTLNPLVKGALDAAGEAIKSGVTAPGDALAGKIPMYDAEGRPSPELIRRGFDVAAMMGGGSASISLTTDTAKAAAIPAVVEHAPVFTT